MAAPDTPEAALRSAADSVFRFLDRTAELTRGGVRWPIPDDAGEPQYRGDLYSNGGIPLFLADYHRLTGSTRALELATRGAAWCAAPDRAFLGDLLSGSDAWSLLDGRAGLGLAWLRLAGTGAGGGAGERAAALGAALLERDPGPATGLGMGAAGKGLVLLRLWQHTRDARHLAGTERCADWLAARAIRDEGGCRWPFREGEPQNAHTSICHGAAGVGYFLLLLYQATGHRGYAELGRAAAATLVRAARPDRGGVNWLPVLGTATDLDREWKPVPARARLRRCQWCTGAPGIGLFLAKAFEVLGDGAALAAAEAAGEATWAYGDGRANPTYCHGLAGNAELFLELHRVTGRGPWLERARDFARRMRAYRMVTPEGEAWPSDAPPQQAPDLLCGAAGVGHVFLRLLHPRDLPTALV
jgi:Lanthionine synthetase C-like protein